MYRLNIKKEFLSTMLCCQLHNPSFILKRISILVWKGNIWKQALCCNFTQIGVSSLCKLKVEELKAQR